MVGLATKDLNLELRLTLVNVCSEDAIGAAKATAKSKMVVKRDLKEFMLDVGCGEYRESDEVD